MGAPDDRWSALYVLAVTTGLRQGELLGLKWEDVDLESATLRVRHTLQPPSFPKGAPARLTPPKIRGGAYGACIPSIRRTGPPQAPGTAGSGAG